MRGYDSRQQKRKEKVALLFSTCCFLSATYTDCQTAVTDVMVCDSPVSLCGFQLMELSVKIGLYTEAQKPADPHPVFEETKGLPFFFLSISRPELLEIKAKLLSSYLTQKCRKQPTFTRSSSVNRAMQTSDCRFVCIRACFQVVAVGRFPVSKVAI